MPLLRFMPEWAIFAWIWLLRLWVPKRASLHTKFGSALVPELVSGNVFFRWNWLRKRGDKVHGHEHEFDHTSFFTCGSFHIQAVLQDGVTVVETIVIAPDTRLILAGVKHEITALEDDSEFVCIYAHRDPQGRVTQEYTGWPKAYC